MWDGIVPVFHTRAWDGTVPVFHTGAWDGTVPVFHTGAWDDTVPVFHTGAWDAISSVPVFRLESLGVGGGGLMYKFDKELGRKRKGKYTMAITING